MSWKVTTHSSIFDRMERLEMDWKLLRILGLSLGFLRMEVTVACLSVWGTKPTLKEELARSEEIQLQSEIFNPPKNCNLLF